MIRKLTAMPYAQAQVVTDEQGTRLISYTTTVVTIDNDGWLTVHGLYSATTRKHISAFMREYTIFDYKHARYLYDNKLKQNVITGEVMSI